jgi:hypothetical protein
VTVPDAEAPDAGFSIVSVGDDATVILTVQDPESGVRSVSVATAVTV